MPSEFKSNKSAIEWRRGKVLEYTAKGHSQNEVAKIQQVHSSTISLDMQYIREQAQENLRVHIQEKIPEQYEKCMSGLNLVLKSVWDMITEANKDNPTMRTSEKLQAYALINDCYKHLMDMNSDSTVIREAMAWVKSKQH